MFGQILGSVISAVGSNVNANKQREWEAERQEQQNKYNRDAAYLEQQFNEKNMGLSFEYGEKAADAADARTRALYEELYGPEATTAAQMKALKENGLSPGLMYGGQGVSSGSSTPSGSRGTGTSPLKTNVTPTNAINPMQGIQMDLAWAQVQKILAETDAITKSTGRAEEQQGLILMNYENANKKLNAEINLLVEQAENEKQKTYLTKWQGKMQKLQTDFFNETKDISKEMLENQAYKLSEEIEAIVRENDIGETTKDAQIKIVWQTYENMCADYMLKKADQALKESGKKLTDAQVKLAKQNLHLAMQQISVNSSEIAKNRANADYLNELAANIEKQFNLNQSLGWGKIGAQFFTNVLATAAILFTKNPKVAMVAAGAVASSGGGNPTSDMYY